MSTQKSVNTSKVSSELKPELKPKPKEADLQTELARLIPEMPEAARQQLAALLDSTENPNPELKQEPKQEFKQQFIDTFQKFDSLTQTDSQVRQLLPEDTTEETLAKELAKVDASQPILESEQQEAAAIFNLMFDSLADSEPCDDIEEIRLFANAATLKDAFPQEEQLAFSTLADDISEESAEIIHAAIACQLAGMTKPAKLLFNLFTQRQFIDANQDYQKLQTEITKQKGVIENSSKAGKSGRNKRYEKRDKVNAYAIQLYSQRNYATPHQAAQLIAEQVMEYAQTIGYSFSTAYQATKTINSWLSKHKKSQL
ncbi:hypothetical protein HWQ46_13380 [Shewanella sp. D64]|uniref:hypothetical protein n=1 Tax=unclassified Shewanella TaxID=196818 RepID=UPI0022BA6D55|nr:MULTISPECIES: hypothetical protein [unclassified Shewanella]MEC4726542.1 hypothetical protein [Shewanella sp. D64]MEC4737417.1 hypothetical protein [Shewanella sp. E94]WBJ97236.1 hypothetical protein HWQ47_09115 [Shewanella sp. MTB7]